MIGKCANRLLGSSGLPQIARQMKVYALKCSVLLILSSLCFIQYWPILIILKSHNAFAWFVEAGTKFYMGPSCCI